MRNGARSHLIAVVAGTLLVISACGDVDESVGGGNNPAGSTTATDECSDTTRPECTDGDTGIECTGQRISEVPLGFPELTSDCPFRALLTVNRIEYAVAGRDGFRASGDGSFDGAGADRDFSLALDVPDRSPGTYYGGDMRDASTWVDDDGNVVGPDLSVPDAVIQLSGGYSSGLDHGGLELTLDASNDVLWGSFEGTVCEFVDATAVGDDVVHTYDCLTVAGEFAGVIAE